MPRNQNYFPHANTILHPMNRFFINGRWLNLYAHANRTPSTPYSLYWQDENNSLQRAMTALEVFTVLAGILNPKNSDT